MHINYKFYTWHVYQKFGQSATEMFGKTKRVMSTSYLTKQAYVKKQQEKLHKTHAR